MNYIYAIKNLKNNKMYIGSTKNLKSRKYQHFRQLKLNLHHSQHLQHSYNKYGKDYFAFYILEECTEENRKSREIYNIEYYKTNDRLYGYNVWEVEESSFKCSNETIQKIKESNVKNGRSIKIDLYSYTNEEYIDTFDSLNDCAKYLNCKHATLSQILKGKRLSHKGFSITLHNESYIHKTSSKQRDMSKYKKRDNLD